MSLYCFFFFFSSRRRHTRSDRDWSSDVCSSDLVSGVTISWSVLTGGGSVNAASSVTNASGIASIDWTLGTRRTATDSVQTAQATGVAAPVQFTAFAVPGAVSPSLTTVVAAPGGITASTGASQSTI